MLASTFENETMLHGKMSTRYACRKRGQCIRQPSPIILRIPPQTNGDSFGSSHTCPRTYQGRRSSRRRDRTSRQVDGGIDRGVSRFGKDAIHLIFLLLSLKKINNCTNWKSSTTPAKLLQTPVEKWGHAWAGMAVEHQAWAKRRAWPTYVRLTYKWHKL